MTVPAPAVLYNERQRFTQLWLWALLAAMAVVETAAFGPVFLPGYVHRPGDAPLWVAGLVIAFTALGLPLFIYSCRLAVEVRSDVLLLQFTPFHLRPLVFNYRDIVSCQPVRYNAVAEYGGWGIRYGAGGKAYNVSGNLGVRLEFTGGARLLIGTQHPQELAGAIAAAMGRR